jgi:hypothetical protein
MSMRVRRRVITIIALLLASQGCAKSTTQKDAEAAVPFGVATVRFEQNATDEDAEVVFEVKGLDDGMSKLEVVAPDGRTVVQYASPDKTTMGIRQFRFESPEPGDVESLKKAYPEGVYVFTGRTMGGESLRGEARLSHELPGTASVVDGPAGPVSDPVVIAWTPVAGMTAMIVALEHEETGNNVTARIPGSSASFTVPAGFIQPGVRYKLALGTVAENGNISVTETEFPPSTPE